MGLLFNNAVIKRRWDIKTREKVRLCRDLSRNVVR